MVTIHTQAASLRAGPLLLYLSPLSPMGYPNTKVQSLTLIAAIASAAVFLLVLIAIFA